MRKEGVEIVAEVAQAHDGSLGILHSFIDAVAKTGADVIKFQMHIAEAESSVFEEFRVHFSREDASRYDYWKRMELSPAQWAEIKNHCETVGLEFACSPFSVRAVDELEQLGIHRYKIGSGEVSNLLMLDRIARTGKEIILSSGMSNLEELDRTVSFLQEFGNPLSILQCTTKYPTMAEDVGLNVMSELAARYQTPVGLSDHSGTIYPSLAAVALGASLIEVHVCFDRAMFGPDTSSSITLSELKQLSEGIRFIQRALNSPIDKRDNCAANQVKQIFEKSLAVNAELAAGHILRKEDLESKKPSGRGIPAQLYMNVVGKRLTKNKSRYDFLQLDDIEPI